MTLLHITSTKQLAEDPKLCGDAIRLAREARFYNDSIGGICRPLEGKLVTIIFYGGRANRTFAYFEGAIKRLGGDIIGIKDASKVSDVEGENLEDTIDAFNVHKTATVLRHPDPDAPERAKSVAKVPIIYAGGSTTEHPVQGLADYVTLLEELKTLDGLKLAAVGNLALSSSVNSLCRMLARHKGVQLYIVTPPELGIQPEYEQLLLQAGATVENVESVAKLPQVDAMYFTQLQENRMTADQRALLTERDRFYLSNKLLESQRGIILHPRPRGAELPDELARHPRVLSSKQSDNALYAAAAFIQLAVLPRETGKNK